jgi:sec-independent protein translocase protein TatB
MFDIGWSELLLIGVVALIAIGPKELPGALRAVGQWTGKIRRMASEFQDQFREAMREAEMADIKKDIDEAASKIHSDLDPFEFKDATSWKPAEPAAPPPADAPPAPPAEAVAEPAQAGTTTESAPSSGTEPTPTNGEHKAITPPADGGRAA